MHLFVIRDFRDRYIASVAIGMYADTRSSPLQYSLQAFVEPSVAGSVVCVTDCSQIVMGRPDSTQIVLRELTQDLTIGYPDDLEVAGAIECELYGALLRCSEDGGSLELFS